MSLLQNLVGLDVNSAAAPSELSLVISKTFTGKDPPSTVLRADVIEREATASGDRTISGNIYEGCTINRSRKGVDEK